MLILTFLLTTIVNFSLSEPLLAHVPSLPLTLGGLNPSSVTTLMNKQYQVLASPQQVPVLSNLAYSINSGASDSINSGSGDLGGFLLQDYPSRTVVFNSGIGQSSASEASQGAGGFFPAGAILQTTGSSPILLSAQNVAGNGFSPISGSTSVSVPIHFSSNGITVGMNQKSGGPGLVSHASSLISNPLLNANVGSFISNNHPIQASIFPSETGTSGSFLSSPGSTLVPNQNNKQLLAALMPGVGVMGATSNGIGMTRPSSTNFEEVVGSSPSYQSQLVELIMPRPGSIGDGTSTQVFPGKIRPSQTQTMEVPCILRVPAPVQITMRRGTPHVMTSGIPPSFNPSPETIGVLRPFNVMPDSDTLLSPIAAPTPSLNDEKSSITKDIPEKENLGSDKGRAELQIGHPEAESESLSGQKLARNGFPIMYAILPSSSTIPAGNSAALSSSNKKKSSSSTSSSSRPSRGKNPYFNVNKRKHFEFYEYF